MPPSILLTKAFIVINKGVLKNTQKQHTKQLMDGLIMLFIKLIVCN